jgi:hypothetical protein
VFFFIIKYKKRRIILLIKIFSSSEYWNSFYPQRNVIAYAVHPPIISPTHYTGEPSHVSDTENTQVIDNSKFELDMMDNQNVYDENGSDIDDAHKSFAPHIEL